VKIGEVVGVVWASRKVKELNGCRMFLVQPLSTKGKKTGNQVIAADPQNIASSGDQVVYVTGTDASQAFDSGLAPVNASIVALVDEIS